MERSLERFVERFERFERFASGVTSRTACARVLAPARANVETDSNHWDELLLRASAGVRTRHCTVRTTRARYLADGAGSDGVLEPLSLQMFAVRYRAGPTLLSTEHYRHRLSVMVLRRQGERRMQLPR